MVVPVAVQGYQELRTIFLAIPVERSMPRRSETEEFKPSSPLPAAARRRNSPSSVLLRLPRERSRPCGELLFLFCPFPSVFGVSSLPARAHRPCGEDPFVLFTCQCVIYRFSVQFFSANQFYAQESIQQCVVACLHDLVRNNCFYNQHACTQPALANYF
jgi:hypothetical protein